MRGMGSAVWFDQALVVEPEAKTRSSGLGICVASLSGSLLSRSFSGAFWVPIIIRHLLFKVPKKGP